MTSVSNLKLIQSWTSSDKIQLEDDFTDNDRLYDDRFKNKPDLTQTLPGM